MYTLNALIPKFSRTLEWNFFQSVLFFKVRCHNTHMYIIIVSSKINSHRDIQTELFELVIHVADAKTINKFTSIGRGMLWSYAMQYFVHEGRYM